MNLDDLAKLAPFADHDGWICGKDFSAPDAADLAAALNEWAELRAYRERTEAERSEMLRLLAYCKPRVQSYEECNETYCANGHDHEVHKRIGELLDAAEGDPAPKEATDGSV
jgi:hypothetical protein